jgi:hypothetical protein
MIRAQWPGDVEHGGDAVSASLLRTSTESRLRVSPNAGYESRSDATVLGCGVVIRVSFVIAHVRCSKR